MKLLVYARHELVGRAPGTEHHRSWRAAAGWPAGAAVADTALLLEGPWPSDGPAATGGPPASGTQQWSLDEAVDGRLEWIDQRAAELAELAGVDPSAPAAAGSPADGISLAYLNALPLRYYLVKLLRPLAYLTELHPLRPGDHLELIAASPRDRDYAEVLSQVCRAAGTHYRVRWVPGGTTPASGFPANRLWRRCAARLAGRRDLPAPGASAQRVVLCGNPRLLDPVCRELLARGCRLWWLYDRFAVRSWLRWRAAGVGQLVCNSSLAQENRLAVRIPARLVCRGVDLAGPIQRWLSERVATRGPRQTRLVEQIDAHFRRARPDVLLLDEDATALARAAVAVGRRYGARSLVLQHGAPYCRFGFAPLAADRILVWGESTRQRLIDWGLPADQIRVTGSTQQEPSAGVPPLARGEAGAVPLRRGGRRRILLLATVPPRDDRPDAAALHLTSRTYAHMLRSAFAAVAGIGRADLIVKLHPRGGDDPLVRSLRAEFPSLGSRLARRGDLRRWLVGVHCVLSCGSSAGVEAALAGVPVIQLAPPGASSFLEHDSWGLVGTARSETELQELLARLAATGWQPPRACTSRVCSACGQTAAGRIADEVLAGGTRSARLAGTTRHPTSSVADRQALPAGYC